MLVVVALGGNALLRHGEPLSAQNQRRNVRIAPVAERHDLVIGHGDRPQVGLLALQGAAHGAQRLKATVPARGSRIGGPGPPSEGIRTDQEPRSAAQVKEERSDLGRRRRAT